VFTKTKKLKMMMASRYGSNAVTSR